MKNVMKYAATFFVVIILVALGSWIEYGRAGMVTVTGTNHRGHTGHGHLVDA
jgi:hypothetical protein